jgi:diadenosine tetraphosphate (Ap4A) HIT family hydrolase
MSAECNFCEIENEEDRIIRRTELITSFLSNPRLAPGHVLIVPNYHAVLPTQIDDKEVLAIHSEANRLTKIMLGSFALGIDRWQKSRPQVPENDIKRDHLHMHLLPSNPGESIYKTGIEWGAGDKWTNLDVLDPDTQLILTMLREE